MSTAWLGADPGGLGAFGVALLHEDGAIETACLSCAQEALDWLEVHPAAVGIDAPMWWSRGRSGDRLADQWLRRTYSIHSGTVQAANSLREAAIVQAAVFAEGLRKRYPALPITEAHPKALLQALMSSEQKFFNLYQINDANLAQHERDAIISAVAAREGFSGRWPRDLVLDRLPEEQDPESYWLAPMHCFWPE
ncbi:DUF429 domain-containing protein [Pelagibius sp. 7325]|uniref:DUF429 domain-containing protein n=1 Tax=Pelagibius sp. 7325 TaxID=3131994 RepID=UPI0030EC246C